MSSSRVTDGKFWILSVRFNRLCSKGRPPPSLLAFGALFSFFSLTRLNKEISHDTKKLTVSEEDALALLRSATNISHARRTGDKTGLTIALDENMQLWTAIQTLVSRQDHPLNETAKGNLIKLANFVVAKTIKYGCDACDKTLDTWKI